MGIQSQRRPAKRLWKTVSFFTSAACSSLWASNDGICTVVWRCILYRWSESAPNAWCWDLQSPRFCCRCGSAILHYHADAPDRPGDVENSGRRDSQTDAQSEASSNPAALRSSKLAVPLLLTLAYAATLGGMATLVGSPTNSQAIGIYRKQLAQCAGRVTFSEWLLSCGPIALFYLLVVWLVLTHGLPKQNGAGRAAAAVTARRVCRLWEK